MKLYEKTIVISKDQAERLNYWLNCNADSSERLNEDDTFVRTAKFKDGFEMDIKCCGTQNDVAWTEAVLFNDGCEMCHTDVCDEYLGTWEIEWGGNVYRVYVTQEDEQGDENEKRNRSLRRVWQQ